MKQCQVIDATGTNLLELVNHVVKRSLVGNEVEYNFDSLVWKTKAGTNWLDRCVISESAFQRSSAQSRWVIDIASFNSSNGTAVIKVAEESLPVNNGGTITQNVSYSWREWSLLTNGEIRLLRVCNDPFEKYTPIK
jgi:hypothetical protein